MRSARGRYDRWLAVLVLVVHCGCASGRFGPLSHAERGETPCPGVSGTPVDRVCREDRSIESLEARFRVMVSSSGAERIADGVLLVRRPDAVRMKLFGFGGMTAYDALWVGDDRMVRGFIRRPLVGEPISVTLRPGERIPDAEAEFSFVLWALWRPRCVRPPTTIASEPGWLRLDPDSAHAIARDVRVGTLGVDEERMVQAQGSEPDVVDVRYLGRDCSRASLLPTRIEMTSRERGWHASVRIVEQEENVDLDDELFALPEPEDVS